ncbi:hypothetical protein B0H14DRAFT_2565004 [Mycena olivaceomarginata]|nr:hypothetical protein B0H14DRAFT_2565004 [Mycena olivaceomarginata]
MSVNFKKLLKMVEEGTNEMHWWRVILLHVLSNGYQDFDPFVAIFIGQRDTTEVFSAFQRANTLEQPSESAKCAKRLITRGMLSHPVQAASKGPKTGEFTALWLGQGPVVWVRCREVNVTIHQQDMFIDNPRKPGKIRFLPSEEDYVIRFECGGNRLPVWEAREVCQGLPI